MEYLCNNTNDIFLFDIPRIFLEQKSYTMDIFRTFFRVNVTFYDAVNIIHDVIITANPFPYTAKCVV